MNNEILENFAMPQPGPGVGRLKDKPPYQVNRVPLLLVALALCASTHAQSTTGIYVNPSNNVGIGTTNPLRQFILYNNYPIIGFQTSSDGLGWGIYSDGSDDSMKFIRYSNAAWTTYNNSILTILTNGNVGIGTTSPNNPLTVSGSGTTKIGLNGGSYTGNELRAGGAAGNMSAGFQIYSGAGQDLSLFTDGGSNGMTVKTGNGRVGIGTTNPAFALDVSSAQASASRIYLHPADGSDYALLQFSNSGGTSYFGMDNSNGNGLGSGTGYALTMYSASVPIVFSSGGAERMRVDTSGNVGIGETGPVAPLDVGGILHVSGNTSPSLPAQGGYVGWNALSGGTGEMDFMNQEGLGSGGFAFFNSNDTTSGRAIVTIDGSGSIFANEFIAASGDVYPDFIFKPGYKLPSLGDEESAIKKEGHLPGIPSEAEAKAHGINLADMQVKLLQKVEELTLHQIEQQKLLENQNERLDEQSQRIEQLEKENTELRAQH